MDTSNSEVDIDSCYIPSFYSDDSTDEAQFKVSDDHLNTMMMNEVSLVKATDDDFIDTSINSRDAQKCSVALSTVLYKGRVFALVCQLKAMLKLLGDSWGFIVSRDGTQFKYVFSLSYSYCVICVSF